jgi:hypothetical protein
MMNSQEEKTEKAKSRKVVVISTAAFWINFALIVITHSFTGRAGAHLDYSISKYVGLSFPSAIAFLIVNTVISFALWKYLKPLLKNNIQKILMIYIIITLVGLSLCPIGLFDEIIPEPVLLGRTPISFLHVITSRSMFVAMAAFSLLTFFLGDANEKLYSRRVRIVNLAFFIYAALCIFIFLFFPQLFWSFDIVFESIYIASFFNVVLAF